MLDVITIQAHYFESDPHQTHKIQRGPIHNEARVAKYASASIIQLFESLVDKETLTLTKSVVSVAASSHEKQKKPKVKRTTDEEEPPSSSSPNQEC